MTSLRVAAVQHDIVWNDRDANFERLAPKVAAAAGAGAGLVMLTETFSTGFGFEQPDFGEPVGGPSATFLADQARTHGVWVGGSCPELLGDTAAMSGERSGDAHDSSHGGEAGPDERPSNVFVLAGPDGTTHRYAKIHPFSHAGEHHHVRAGTELVTVEVAGFRVSMFVCYDLRFADEFWQLAPHTDLYLVPANWPEKRRHHWTTLLRARAIENQAYVMGVNRVGEGGGLNYSGDSRIIDPLGEVLAGAAMTESILLADLSTEHVAATRDHFRFLPDRR
jgi:predicted amidohydrolase